MHRLTQLQDPGSRVPANRARPPAWRVPRPAVWPTQLQIARRVIRPASPPAVHVRADGWPPLILAHPNAAERPAHDRLRPVRGVRPDVRHPDWHHGFPVAGARWWPRAVSGP